MVTRIPRKHYISLPSVEDLGDGCSVVKKRDPKTKIIVSERYYRGDLWHREGDLPANIERDPATGRVLVREYALHGTHNRIADKPTRSMFDRDTGNLERDLYHRNGVLGREGDKPAVVIYDPIYGLIVEEDYYKDGELGREGDKPSKIFYDFKGRKFREEYFQNDRRHRENGKAAVIYFDPETGEIKKNKSQYWVRGKKITANMAARLSFIEDIEEGPATPGTVIKLTPRMRLGKYEV